MIDQTQHQIIQKRIESYLNWQAGSGEKTSVRLWTEGAKLHAAVYRRGDARRLSEAWIDKPRTAALMHELHKISDSLTAALIANSDEPYPVV